VDKAADNNAIAEDAEEGGGAGEEEDGPATLSDVLRRVFAELIANPATGLFEGSAAATAAAALSTDGDAGVGEPRAIRRAAVAVLPRADAAPGDLRAVGRLLAKALIEGIALEAPLAPTALAALLGRLSGGGGAGNGVLAGEKTALEHLSAWDAAESDRLWTALLAGAHVSGGTGGQARAGAVAAAAAAAVLLGGGRREALDALHEGFAETMQRAGLEAALGVLDEWCDRPAFSTSFTLAHVMPFLIEICSVPTTCSFVVMTDSVWLPPG
jgi:hypothetical protein